MRTKCIRCIVSGESVENCEFHESNVCFHNIKVEITIQPACACLCLLAQQLPKSLRLRERSSGNFDDHNISQSFERLDEFNLNIQLGGVSSDTSCSSTIYYY